jgi:hypothetical protein
VSVASASEIQVQAIQALADIAKSGGASGDIMKGAGAGFTGEDGTFAPKSFFTDPYQYLEHMGIGYREIPHELTYGTLKAMADRCSPVTAIIHTRCNQASNFCHRPENKYAVGMQVHHKDRKRKLSPGEKRHVYEMEEFLLNCGDDRNDERDDFETFIRKAVVDSLRYDQWNFEVVPKWNRLPHSFYAVDASTVRFLRSKRRKGGPSQTYQDYQKARYCQVIEGRIVTEYTEDELSFAVRNPRSDVYQGGYGRSELEDLIMIVTSQLWAEQWNRNIFSQGSTTKGVFLVKGNVPPAQMEAFRRMWVQQISSVSNAWKTPIINSEDAEWISMQPNNSEMGFQAWLEYLIKIAAAVYQIDPAEINFDTRTGVGQNAPLFMTNNTAQQQVSKDRGLVPLMRFLQKQLNKKIITKIDPDYEMEFVGLDQKSQEQVIELQLKEVQNKKTLNEVRAEDDLPPLEHGDIPLNPIYSALKMAADQAKMAQAQGQGGQPGQPLQPGQNKPAQVKPVPQEGKPPEQKVEFPFAATEKEAGDHINYMAGEIPGGNAPEAGGGGADFAASIRRVGRRHRGNALMKGRPMDLKNDHLMKSIVELSGARL